MLQTTGRAPVGSVVPGGRLWLCCSRVSRCEQRGWRSEARLPRLFSKTPIERAPRFAAASGETWAVFTSCERFRRCELQLCVPSLLSLVPSRLWAVHTARSAAHSRAFSAPLGCTRPHIFRLFLARPPGAACDARTTCTAYQQPQHGRRNGFRNEEGAQEAAHPDVRTLEQACVLCIAAWDAPPAYARTCTGTWDLAHALNRTEKMECFAAVTDLRDALVVLRAAIPPADLIVRLFHVLIGPGEAC